MRRSSVDEILLSFEMEHPQSWLLMKKWESLQPQAQSICLSIYTRTSSQRPLKCSLMSPTPCSAAYYRPLNSVRRRTRSSVRILRLCNLGFGSRRGLCLEAFYSTGPPSSPKKKGSATFVAGNPLQKSENSRADGS